MVFKKSFFRIGMWHSRSPRDPPPPLHGKYHLKFPFWLSAPLPYVVCRQVGVSLRSMKLTLWENDQAKKMKYDVCLKLFFGVHISDKKVKDNFSGLASLSPLDCGAQSTRISGREDLKYNSPDDLQNINLVLKKYHWWISIRFLSTEYK